MAQPEPQVEAKQTAKQTAKPIAKPIAAGRRIRGLSAEQRRDQRREQLLDAALELIAAHGYPAVSIEQICQAAYVSTKSFYDLFDGKEDCYLALLRRISAELQARMVTALAEATPLADGPDGALALVDTFARVLLADPRAAKVVFGGQRAVSAAVELVRRSNRRWAAEFVQATWQRFGIHGVHRAVAIGFIGGFFDLIADWLLDADPADPVQVDALVADLHCFYAAVRDGLMPR